MRTLKFTKHNPKHLSTLQLPVNYDRKAKCPTWERIVKQTFPDDTIASGLAWEIAAWLMLPCMSLQKALVLVVPPGTGKNTFLTRMTEFLGPRNVSALSLQALEEIPFASSGLVGKLANICSDLPARALDDIPLFKTITGGDQIPVEYKQKDFLNTGPL